MFNIKILSKGKSVNHRLYLSLSLLLATSIIHPLGMKIDALPISPMQKNIQLEFDLDTTEKILKQTLSVSLDNPNAKLGQISITPTATKKYLPEFSDSKEVIDSNTTMTVPVLIDTNQPLETNIHVSFLLLPDNVMSEKIIQVSFNQPQDSANDVDSGMAKRHPSYGSPSHTPHKSFTESIQHLVQTSDSLWIKLLFAFLLGLLLSLTPCIYPMIPITIGILHHHAKKSILNNFLGSCFYAFGLSTMFAALGLLAAFFGASFGGLLSNPIFVLVLVAFIGYMSLTMIGVIDLTVPSFLQRSTSLNSKFGPFLSAYIFGLISGSVASPCVSPGLALLLTIVATMGSLFIGFLLLFSFGIGISTPLIIIGTFSSSMQMLPRAGQWMVEIKKALGFVMLATCLYYLNNIMPSCVMPWIVVVYILFAALFYIIDAQKDFDAKTKTIKSLMGIVLLALTVAMSFKAFDQLNSNECSTEQHGVVWVDDYQEAVRSAQADKKLLLLDFWANHCTICKAIEKKIFHQDNVWNALKDQFVFVTVDCTSNANQDVAMLKEKFKVFAQPAILIVNPNSEEVLKKWSSEPYSMTPDEFVKNAQSVA